MPNDNANHAAPVGNEVENVFHRLFPSHNFCREIWLIPLNGL